MSDPDRPAGCAARLLRWTLGLYLTCTLLGAVAWAVLFPGGFPVGHPRLWANRALPGAVVVACAAALVAMFRRRETVARAVAVACVSFWLALAASWLVVFPASRLRSVALFVAFVGPQLLVAAWVLAARPRPRWTAVAVAALGCAVGALVPLTQVAPPAATRPFAERLPADLLRADGSPAVGMVDLAPGIHVHPSRGTVTVEDNSWDVTVWPLLGFTSRTADLDAGRAAAVGFAPASGPGEEA